MGEKPPRRARGSVVGRRAGVGGSGRVQAAARSSGRENRVVFHRTRGPERTPYRFFNPIVIAAWARAPLAAPDILRGPRWTHSNRRSAHVPDFPKAGILFYDVTTLLRDPEGFRARDRQHGRTVSRIEASTWSSASRAAASFSERRSPIASAPASCRCARSASCRRRTIRATYDLEYGSDSLEMHRDAIEPGQRVLIVDDLLATGGTARATVDLVKQLGGDGRGRRVPDRAGRR